MSARKFVSQWEGPLGRSAHAKRTHAEREASRRERLNAALGRKRREQMGAIAEGAPRNTLDELVAMRERFNRRKRVPDGRMRADGSFSGEGQLIGPSPCWPAGSPGVGGAAGSTEEWLAWMRARFPMPTGEVERGRRRRKGNWTTRPVVKMKRAA